MFILLFVVLCVFDVVVCYFSFICVVDELGMIQVVVSYQICLLEEWLGMLLFLCKLCEVMLIECGVLLVWFMIDVFDMLCEVYFVFLVDVVLMLLILIVLIFVGVWLLYWLGKFQLDYFNLVVCLEISDDVVDFVCEDIIVVIWLGKGDWLGLELYFLMFIEYILMLLFELVVWYWLDMFVDLLKLLFLDCNDFYWVVWMYEVQVDFLESYGWFGLIMLIDLYEVCVVFVGYGVVMLMLCFFGLELVNGSFVQLFV